MKLARTILWSALALAILGSPTLAQADTVEGTLVDSKCYLGDNSLTTNDHGDMEGCGTMCLKMGQPAGIVTEDGKFYPVIASSIALAPHVGHKVRVTGTLHDGAILAEKAEMNSSGTYSEIKLGAMM